MCTNRSNLFWLTSAGKGRIWCTFLPVSFGTLGHRVISSSSCQTTPLMNEIPTAGSSFWQIGIVMSRATPEKLSLKFERSSEITQWGCALLYLPDLNGYLKGDRNASYSQGIPVATLSQCHLEQDTLGGELTSCPACSAVGP